MNAADHAIPVGFGGEIINTDRACARCGYNLRGLRTGDPCPECGAHVRYTPPASRFVDNICDAPVPYLRRLSLGFMLLVMAVPITGSAIPLAAAFAVAVTRVGGVAPPAPTLPGAVPAPAGLGAAAPHLAFLGLLIGVCVWGVGLVIVTIPRPHDEHTARDPLLDNRHLRLATRIAAWAWVPAIAVAWSAAPMTGIAQRGMVIFADVLALIALFGVVPVSVYLSGMADWAGDPNAGERMRISAWGVTVLGGGGLLCAAIGRLGLGFSGFFNILAIWLGLALVLVGLVFIIGLVQIAMAAGWSVTSAKAIIARDIRVAQRRAERAAELGERLDAVGATGVMRGARDAAAAGVMFNDDGPLEIEGGDPFTALPDVPPTPAQPAMPYRSPSEAYRPKRTSTDGEDDEPIPFAN